MIGMKKLKIASEFFSRFSQNQIFRKKTSVSPPFLRHGKRDRAETFFTYTSHYLGWVFFLFQKILHWLVLAAFTKNCTSEKTAVF